MDMQATAVQTKKVGKRFSGWWGLAILAMIVVIVRAPQQLEVLVYKVLQLALAVGLAYMADRSLFKNAPGIDLNYDRDSVSASRIIARGLVFLAVVVGICVGI
jgi:hypothetical protein